LEFKFGHWLPDQGFFRTVPQHNSNLLVEMNLFLKCKKCRCVLIEHTLCPILNCHGDEANFETTRVENCKDTIDAFYFQETGLPEWILHKLNEADWSKGKLMCPKCFARLGSFDFVSGKKCQCMRVIVPPVHIVKSKVDYHLITGIGIKNTNDGLSTQFVQ